MPIFIYVMLMVGGYILQYMNVPYILDIKMYEVGAEIAKKYDCFKVGLSGVGLSLGMMIRERVLRKYRNESKR